MISIITITKRYAKESVFVIFYELQSLENLRNLKCSGIYIRYCDIVRSNMPTIERSVYNKHRDWWKIDGESVA